MSTCMSKHVQPSKAPSKALSGRLRGHVGIGKDVAVKARELRSRLLHSLKEVACGVVADDIACEQYPSFDFHSQPHDVCTYLIVYR